VTNVGDDTVSVIDTGTNTVTNTIPVGSAPHGITVSPDGSKVYVTNLASNTVSVIGTGTNTVTNTIPVGTTPWGIAVTSDGSKIYVANFGSNSVSVIDTGTNTVTNTIPVGTSPFAFGQFITSTVPVLKINDFTAIPTSGNAPLTVNFASSVSDSPTKWTWKFEKCATQSFNVGTATHIYDDVGVFDVTLTVKDAAGHTDTLTKKAYITVLQKIKPPIADFSAKPTEVKVSKPVQFTDKSKNNPDHWLWDFGDGTQSNIQNPPHAYV
jgi:YVTN family beta-propeller protein